MDPSRVYHGMCEFIYCSQRKTMSTPIIDRHKSEHVQFSKSLIKTSAEDRTDSKGTELIEFYSKLAPFHVLYVNPLGKGLGPR